MPRAEQFQPGKHTARLKSLRSFQHDDGMKPVRFYFDFVNEQGQETSFSTTFGFTNDGQHSEQALGFARKQFKTLGIHDLAPFITLCQIINGRPDFEVVVEDSQWRSVKFINQVGPGYRPPPQKHRSAPPPTDDPNEDMYDSWG